jgi:hypothetical protein
MDLQKELSVVEQMVREKTPSHVMPTIEIHPFGQGIGA